MYRTTNYLSLLYNITHYAYISPINLPHHRLLHYVLQPGGQEVTTLGTLDI